MLEFNAPKSAADTEQVVKVREKKFLGSTRVQPGHSLFEFDTVNGTLQKVGLIKEAQMDGTVKSRVDRKPGCVYVTALNKRNAARKLKLTQVA